MQISAAVDLGVNRTACLKGPFPLFARLYVIILLILAEPTISAQSDRGAEGWSQDLLTRLLTAPVPEVGALGSSTAGGEGMVLHSYQLRLLHLGDPGRATNLVSILQRMLPPDSRVTEDRAGNTLHILSTGTAHQAALELISAMDGENPASHAATQTASVPDEVRQALEALASARPDSEQLIKIVADSSRQTEERLSQVVRQSQHESRENLRHMLVVGSVTGVVLMIAGLGLFSIATRRMQKKKMSELGNKEASSLALLPTQSMEAIIATNRDQQERTKELQKMMESFSIAYQADRQRNTIMMETVVKKHGELASTLTQMEQLRRKMGDDLGKSFLDANRDAIERVVSDASTALQTRAAEVSLIAETASKKMDDTANRLEVQNARASVLADELERTQKEVDALFEKLKTAQETAQQAQGEANEQRRIAYEKTIELTRKEAALAGLSLLLQEPANDILDTLNAVRADSLPGLEIEPPTPDLELPSSDTNLTAEFTFPPPGPASDSLPPALIDSSPCLPHPYTFRITPAA